MILDVRELEEFQEEHIPGSVHIPLSLFTSMAPELLVNIQDPEVIILCRSGKRAQIAKEILAQLDLVEMNKISVYEGGILRWAQEGRPTKKGGPKT